MTWLPTTPGERIALRRRLENKDVEDKGFDCRLCDDGTTADVLWLGRWPLCNPCKAEAELGAYLDGEASQ